MLRKLLRRPRLQHRRPAAAPKRPPIAPKKPDVAPKRENALQKISHLDVKGRIQLALKGNKEERSLLIRDGTKVVALAVLEAPKLSDGEVEKFASQKNVLEVRAAPDSAEAPLHEELQGRAQSGGEPAHPARSRAWA